MDCGVFHVVPEQLHHAHMDDEPELIDADRRMVVDEYDVSDCSE